MVSSPVPTSSVLNLSVNALTSPDEMLFPSNSRTAINPLIDFPEDLTVPTVGEDVLEDVTMREDVSESNPVN